MTAAAQTKEHEDKACWDKAGENKESRKQGTKARNRTQGTHSNKSSRLCYKAETGTLSHRPPSYSCSRRRRHQMSLLPLSSPPPANKSTKTKQSCLGSGAVATQVPLVSRTGTLPHDLLFHFCIHSSTAVSVRLPLPFSPLLPLSLLLASSVVWRSHLPRPCATSS